MYVCVYLVHWLYYFFRARLLYGREKKKKWCFDQELGRTKDGVNCTRRSFPVKRWMDKYMGFIFFFKHKLKKEHVRVDCRVTDST